jgi:Xaa-Pro dipeptidase
MFKSKTPVIAPVITNQEYLDRMARLRHQVAASGLDVFIVSSTDSIYYLTGISYIPFERPFFIIVKPDGPASLLVPTLEKVHLQGPNIDIVHSYWDYPSPAGQGWTERLNELLSGAKAVGVEPTLPLEIHEKIKDFSISVKPLVERLRLVKSPGEVHMIRQAARYADFAVRKVIAATYYGVSDLELFSQSRAVQMQIMKDTDYDILTTSILCGAYPGPVSAQPHGVPTPAARLKEGSHIAGAAIRANGYSAECERTIFTTRPSGDLRDAFAAMVEARRRAFDLVKPGAACAEIDKVASGYLSEKGYSECLLHRTGHGFGLSIHEGPWVAEGSNDILAENMLISLEPGIYLPGIGGVRHSDTVLVTRDGYEKLTHYPSDIESSIIIKTKPFNRLQGAIIRKVVGMK